jgi:heme-degrading monooxygenase HmoA
MHARVWHVRIQAGRTEEFISALDSLLPAARKQPGFRAALVLRTNEGKAPEATVIAVYKSLEDIKASEKNLFLYQTISRILSYCEGFPNIREEEVLLSDFVQA